LKVLIKKKDITLKPRNFNIKIVTNNILNKILIHLGIFVIKLLKNNVLLIKLELEFASCDPPTVTVNISFNGTEEAFNKPIVKGAPSMQKSAN